jgi:hypothetical protein
MPAEGRGLGSRLVLKVAKHRRLGQPYRTPLMCESRGRPRTPKRRENLGVGLGSQGRPKSWLWRLRAIELRGVRRDATARAVGRLAARDLPVCEGVLSCPRAGCVSSARPVR